MKVLAGIFLLFLVTLTVEAQQKCPKGNCICTLEYDPVCSKQGCTYGNLCTMKCAGQQLWHRGACYDSTHYRGK